MNGPYLESIRCLKPYYWVACLFKKYDMEFCCHGNKGHIRSKIAQNWKWFVDISNAILLAVICIKFEEGGSKKTEIQGQMAR